MNARRNSLAVTTAAGLLWLLPGVAAAEEGSTSPTCETPVSSEPGSGDGAGTDGGTDPGSDGSEPRPGGTEPGTTEGTEGGTVEPGPGPDEPPADEPPADEPPADEPPAVDEPPVDEPPAVDEPTTDAPPTGDDCLAYASSGAPADGMPEGAVQKNLDAKGPQVLGDRATNAAPTLPYTGSSDIVVLAIVGLGLISLGFGAQRVGAASTSVVVRAGRHRI